MKYRESWELPSIPNEVFWPEVGRRRNEIASGGRPKTLRDCEYCGQQYSAREMRKHKPLCPKGPNKKTKKGK
ncbi:hypothetical protein EDE15_1052 [Edaphobacter aggregans]|uniref:Zinc finger protein n=1 Tax=Edaphobacter aggregans TaxID=570835 RepID=A0A428MF45_9BACT|nr:hypothetical protein EDE15_1052 [Edaphobacter aggregans]